MCVDRLLGQDVSWLDSAVNNGTQPWIRREPHGCANQYRSLIAQNRCNVIAWKLIPICFLAQLQPHSFLWVLDTITCPWSTPLPPHLFPNPCFNAPEVFVSFIIRHLPTLSERRWGVALLSDYSRYFLVKNLDLLRLAIRLVCKMDQGS